MDIWRQGEGPPAPVRLGQQAGRRWRKPGDELVEVEVRFGSELLATLCR